MAGLNCQATLLLAGIEFETQQKVFNIVPVRERDLLSKNCDLHFRCMHMLN